MKRIGRVSVEYRDRQRIVAQSYDVEVLECGSFTAELRDDLREAIGQAIYNQGTVTIRPVYSQEERR